MTGTAFNPTGGYGGSFTTNPDGALLTDDENGNPALTPLLTPSGNLVPAQVGGNAIANGSGLPPLNAILVELRLISELLAQDRGALAWDLQQMRGDLALNQSPATGVL